MLLYLPLHVLHEKDQKHHLYRLFEHLDLAPVGIKKRTKKKYINTTLKIPKYISLKKDHACLFGVWQQLTI